MKVCHTVSDAWSERKVAKSCCAHQYFIILQSRPLHLTKHQTSLMKNVLLWMFCGRTVCMYSCTSASRYRTVITCNPFQPDRNSGLNPTRQGYKYLDDPDSLQARQICGSGHVQFVEIYLYMLCIGTWACQRKRSIMPLAMVWSIPGKLVYRQTKAPIRYGYISLSYTSYYQPNCIQQYSDTTIRDWYDWAG